MSMQSYQEENIHIDFYDLYRNVKCLDVGEEILMGMKQSKLEDHIHQLKYAKNQANSFWNRLKHLTEFRSPFTKNTIEISAQIHKMLCNAEIILDRKISLINIDDGTRVPIRSFNSNETIKQQPIQVNQLDSSCQDVLSGSSGIGTDTINDRNKEMSRGNAIAKSLELLTFSPMNQHVCMDETPIQNEQHENENIDQQSDSRCNNETDEDKDCHDDVDDETDNQSNDQICSFENVSTGSNDLDQQPQQQTTVENEIELCKKWFLLIDLLFEDLIMENYDKKMKLSISNAPFKIQSNAESVVVLEKVIHYLLDRIVQKYNGKLETMKLYSKLLIDFNQRFIVCKKQFRSILLDRIKYLYVQDLYFEFESMNEDQLKNYANSKIFTRLFNDIEKKKCMARTKYEANLILINQLYEDGFIDAHFLTRCLNHILDQIDQGSETYQIDYLSCLYEFIKLVQPNLEQLSKDSMDEAKNYRNINIRLHKVLKSLTPPPNDITFASMISEILVLLNNH